MRPVTIVCVALLCGAMLMGGALGDSATQCVNTMVKNYKSDVKTFGDKMTACLKKDAGEDCCDQVNELFADDGVLADCLCNDGFSSMILDTVSAAGASADDVKSMWEECGVPALGMNGCSGLEEPKVKAQLLLKKMLLGKLLVKKALLQSLMQPAVVAEEEEEEEEEEVTPVVVVPTKKAHKVVVPPKGL